MTAKNFTSNQELQQWFKDELIKRGINQYKQYSKAWFWHMHQKNTHDKSVIQLRDSLSKQTALNL